MTEPAADDVARAEADAFGAPAVAADTPPDADAPVPGVDVADPGSGDPRVDAAIGLLDGLDDAPTAEHVAVFEDVHGRLHDALADLGSAG